MANTTQRRAFISYSRVNKEFATKLTQGLRTAGYPVWFDQLDIPTGSRWDDEVEKALRECSIFMIILTPASILSENVKDEIGYAIDHGKRILPVLLEDCDVPLRLRRFQYVDFTTKSFEEGFASAKELLGDLIGEVSKPLPAQTPAVESKPESIKAAPAPIMEARKVGTAAGQVPQQKSGSMNLYFGIGAVAVLVLAVIAYGALSKGGGDNNPPAENPAPATEAPIAAKPATEAPAAVEPATEAAVVVLEPTDVPAPRASNFQACAEPCTGQNSSAKFAAGITVIHIQFDYENFAPGARYTRTWTNDGDEWIQYSCAWDGPASGTEKTTITTSKGLRPGKWEMTVAIDNVTLLQEAITLTGTHDFWFPQGVQDKCRRE